jgi:hypothetical protein
MFIFSRDAYNAASIVTASNAPITTHDRFTQIPAHHLKILCLTFYDTQMLDYFNNGCRSSKGVCIYCLLLAVTIEERSDEQGNDEKPRAEHNDRREYRIHYTLLVWRQDIPAGVIHTRMTPVTVRRDGILCIVFLLIVYVDEPDDRGNEKHGRDETGGNAQGEQGTEALVAGEISKHKGTETCHGRERGEKDRLARAFQDKRCHAKSFEFIPMEYVDAVVNTDADDHGNAHEIDKIQEHATRFHDADHPDTTGNQGNNAE